MSKRLLLLCLIALSGFIVKADDYDTLYQRLLTNYLTATPKSHTVIQSYMDDQQTNGSWADINYDFHGTPWSPLVHWDRLWDMALAFKKTSHALYGNATLRTKIKLGLLYWYNRTSQPYADNWFDNDLLKQERIYKILTLIKNDFTSEPEWTDVIKTGCNRYLVLPADYATTNKSNLTNAVWFSRILIHHGVIEKEAAKLQEGINNMAAQLVIQPINVEGVQEDGSFLFHGKQIYNSGYGGSLISDVSYYMYQTRGLALVGFTTAQVDALSHLILKGDQWMIHGQAYDFGVCGRNISRKDNGSSSYLKTILPRMMLIDPGRTAQYQTMLDHVRDQSGVTAGVIGNKHFYRADYMVHRRPNLFMGVKMCSSRTRGTESLSAENLLGNWLPFGATAIMRRGDEYENIFAVWDWSKIPGVTNPGIVVTWPSTGTTNSTQSTSFVGGVSDGQVGVTAMDYDKVTIVSSASVDIKAKKANFFWDNQMVCLGAGITSAYAAAATTTTLNQSNLKGLVLIDGNVVPQQQGSFANVKWVHHDSTGYVFRSNTTIGLKNNAQTGNWYTINHKQPNAVVSSDVFKLWLDHGSAPSNASYEYLVLPNHTAAQTSTFANDIPFVTVSNTSALQAVTNKTLQQTAAVFYTAGTLNIHTTLRVAVDKPCALIIDWSVNPIKVTVSDPSQTQTAVELTITYSQLKEEKLAFNLPSGTLKGSSLTKTAATTRLLDERFYNTNDMTMMSGGIWSVIDGELDLSNPASNGAIPANINLSNTEISGDFVMTVRAKVTGTTSILDDLCLIWNHQKTSNSYYYASFSENNDINHSGVFKVVNGIRSAQLSDITTGIVANTWTNLEVQKVGSTMKVYLNGALVSQISDSSLSDGYVGLGSYNNACRFENLSVLRYNTSLNTFAALQTEPTSTLTAPVNNLSLPQLEKEIKIYPNPSSGVFKISLPEGLAGATIQVFDNFGLRIFSQANSSTENEIRLHKVSNGIGIVIIQKEGRTLRQKIILDSNL